MALQESINDREKNKFRDAGNNLSKVAISLEDGLLSGIVYTKILATYPTSSTELYEYYEGAILNGSILVTYTDSTKSVLTSAERV